MGHFLIGIIKYLWRIIVLGLLLGAFIWIITFCRNASSVIDPTTGAFTGSNNATQIIDKAQDKLDDIVDRIIADALD